MFICKGILAVGDDKGSIFLYNIENILKKKKSLDSLFVPSKVTCINDRN